MKVLLTGEGGQGIQTIAQILANCAYRQGFFTTYLPHYGVEMRMGISIAYVQIAKQSINSPKFNHADILVMLSRRNSHSLWKFNDQSSSVINLVDFDQYLGTQKPSQKSLNMVALGVIVKELRNFKIFLDEDVLKEEIKLKLSKKPGLEDNILAFDNGLNLAPEQYKISLNRIRKTILKPLVNDDKDKRFVRFGNLCKSCGLCLEKCPTSALSWSGIDKNYLGLKMPEVNLSKCIACKTCENICPDCAIKVDKKS